MFKCMCVLPCACICMCVCVFACVCVSVCVGVCGSERERGVEVYVCGKKRVCVGKWKGSRHVCVCACV